MASPSFAQAPGHLFPVKESLSKREISIGADQEQLLELSPEAHSHLWVSIGERSEVTVVIHLKGSGEIHHAIEVHVAPEAQCTILTINRAASDATLKMYQHGRTGSGATIRWQNVTLGGGKVDHQLVSTVIGPDGESAVDWMFYAKQTERYDLNVRNVFNAPNGRGEILMRGIAEQKGHALCRGLIEIGLKGGGTNTYLTQEVLMLDATSKVDAIPSLEIKTNDVKASHSATIARVTEEDLFYFGARGIAPVDARRMFVLGFLGDITSRISDEAMREELVGLIEQKYSVG